MKVSAKQYAQLLWDSLENQEDVQRTDIVKNFVQVLWRKRQLRLGDKIVEALKEIEKKEEGLVQARVQSAFGLNEAEKKDIEEFLKKELNCKTVDIDFQEDKSLIGGILVEAEGYVWDMSIAGGTKKLKQVIK